MNPGINETWGNVKHLKKWLNQSSKHRKGLLILKKILWPPLLKRELLQWPLILLSVPIGRFNKAQSGVSSSCPIRHSPELKANQNFKITRWIGKHRKSNPYGQNPFNNSKDHTIILSKFSNPFLQVCLDLKKTYFEAVKVLKHLLEVQFFLNTILSGFVNDIKNWDSY
jgi:hypothetical protein